MSPDSSSRAVKSILKFSSVCKRSSVASTFVRPGRWERLVRGLTYGVKDRPLGKDTPRADAA